MTNNKFQVKGNALLFLVGYIFYANHPLRHSISNMGGFLNCKKSSNCLNTSQHLSRAFYQLLSHN